MAGLTSAATGRSRPSNLREAGVAVIGLGYVGLPLASMLSLAGVRVHGVDVDQALVASVSAGSLATTEPELDSMVQAAVHSGRLTLSTRVTRSAAYVIAVPTPVRDDRTADLTHLRSALASVAGVIGPGELLVVESTIPPGTMTGVVVPELTRLRGDVDGLLIAHCPERMMPGSAVVELVNNDRVIGGIDEASCERADELYSTFVKGELFKTDLTTAEMVKVMENTYRDVNIALANEFAKLAESAGIDVWEAIALANHHPRVNILRPGPGVGGHCIAVDPWFLVKLDAARARLIQTARDVNDAMPSHVVDRAARMVRGDAHVAVLGLAYRGDIGDTRESPALEVCRELERRQIRYRAHDPFAPQEVEGIPNRPLDHAIAGAELVLLLTDHKDFRALDPVELAGKMTRPAVFDARGCLPIERWTDAGFRAEVLGVPAEGA